MIMKKLYRMFSALLLVSLLFGAFGPATVFASQETQTQPDGGYITENGFYISTPSKPIDTSANATGADSRIP